MGDSTLAREVVPLRTPFEFDRSHPVEFNLNRIRRLRQAFAEPRPVVEAEPGLVLQAPASAPELTVVSRAARQSLCNRFQASLAAFTRDCTGAPD